MVAGSAEEEVADERCHGCHQLGTSPPSPSKELISDQSTCSDGSLLSMGSSDLDEDSCGQSSSRHSSRLSLQDKRTPGDGDLEVSVSTTPLSHSAARHKMAVKPKRTHGAPRRRRVQQLSAPVLPATPELNEDPSGRSMSPDLAERPEPSSRLAPPSAAAEAASANAAPTPAPRTILSTGPAHYQLKSASLPAGAALQRGAGPAWPSSRGGGGQAGPGPGRAGAVTVTRSRSSAAARQQSADAGLELGQHGQHPHGPAAAARRSGSSDQLDRDRDRDRDLDEAAAPGQAKGKRDKEDLSFFGRLLSRRSGKKKKGERGAGQPPAPVLPAGAANATASAYHSVYHSAATDAVDAGCALPTRRLDEKGRYVAEAREAEHAALLLAKQAQAQAAQASAHAPQVRPRQRLEPLTIPPRDAEEDAEADESSVHLPRTTTPLDGVPIPVKPEPALAAAAAAVAQRMQQAVSYSTSPPPPLWPASETKVVEVIEKTPEARSLFEQESRLRASGTRLPVLSPGLAALQQRIGVGLAAPAHADDARASSPLGEDASRGPHRRPLPTSTASEKEVLRHFDEEMSTLSLTPSLNASETEAFSGSPDSLESCPTTPAATAPAERRPLAKPVTAEENTARGSGHGPTKGSAPTGEPTPALPPRPEPTGAPAMSAKGKSSSLGNIESLGPACPPPPQPLPKASSSDSISGTKASQASQASSPSHQVTILSITQRAADAESAKPKSHSVTVACVPDPTPTPKSASSPSTTSAGSPAPTPSTSPSSTPTSTASTAAAGSGPASPAALAVTLVNLPCNLPSPTTSPTDPDATLGHGTMDNDKTEPSDLPAEAAAEQLPPRPSVPSVLRKSLPPLPVAAAGEETSSAQLPEFMRVQLNRVDSKPALNVVLSTARTGPAQQSPQVPTPAALDPWAVDEVGTDAAAVASPPPVAVLGLRAKRSSSRDSLSQPAEPADTADCGFNPTPPSPTKSPAVSPVKPTPPPQSQARKQPPPIKRMLSEDNNNVIIVEKKDKKQAVEPQSVKTPPVLAAQDDASLGLRWKSASRDSLQLEDKADREQPRDASVSPVLDGVVLRKKSLPRDGSVQGKDRRQDDTPELMKVFARRSLKVRDSEAELTLSTLSQASMSSEDSGSAETSPQRASRDSDKENEGDGAESPKEFGGGGSPALGVAPISASSPGSGQGAALTGLSRFQRAVSMPVAVPPTPAAAPPTADLARPGTGPAKSPAGDRPLKPAKPAEAIKDSNSNRLRTRKLDNVLSNGNSNNNNNINNNIVVEKATLPSNVSKVSARWTLPAEARPTTKPVPPVAAVAADSAEPSPKGSPRGSPTAAPKFKRIQQRREEWEQRAKALQRATQ